MATHFWQSILLYIYRPNLINRRYIGAQVIFGYKCRHKKNITLQDIEQLSIWTGTSLDSIQAKFDLSPWFDQVEVSHLNNGFPTTFLLVRKLFRKRSLKYLKTHSVDSSLDDNEYDLLVLDNTVNRLVSLPVKFDETSKSLNIDLQDNVFYSLTLADECKLSFSYLFGSTNNYWLEQVLKPKLEQWMLVSQSNGNNTFQGSIKMISVESYCSNYNRMKAKYSMPLLDIWSQVEKTDPLKFIFEDIAIAAYLVTLWQEEQQKHSLDQKQTFADIGCGNGLLVHILAGEGYQGYGVDLRRRNIWQHYGPEVKLIEMQIDPFNETFFTQLPMVDWMIGNHSDELTPWIIYMASCASSQTRAFILPCCCFDFDGFKFQRTTEQNKSQYQCYIDYLYQMAHQFGFNCFRDKLRIPSTKRLCLVCFERNYPTPVKQSSIDGDHISSDLQESQMKLKRAAFVKERLQIRADKRLRNKEELVRNCTRIDFAIKQEIINRLTEHLLRSDDQEGLTFIEAIGLLNQQARDQLKRQCGGLQTFVRNHKHIFRLAEGRIRFQSPDQLRAKSERPRRRPCWFFAHHPRGCPLTDLECAYLHTTTESIPAEKGIANCK